MDTVTRCVPQEADRIERDPELQGRGSVDGSRIQIDVYLQSVGGTPSDDVSWAGPEGVSGARGEVDVTWTSDRVTGSATLHDAREQAEPIVVTIDLPVPEDLFPCR